MTYNTINSLCIILGSISLYNISNIKSGENIAHKYYYYPGTNIIFSSEYMCGLWFIILFTKIRIPLVQMIKPLAFMLIVAPKQIQIYIRLP